MKGVVKQNNFDENVQIPMLQSAVISLQCLVCGANQRRETANFCLTCGHDLHEDYAPLDSLKASYNLRKQIEKPQILPVVSQENHLLFAENNNGAAATANAFVVYSLVPYLGILFYPGALVFGGIGLAISFQNPRIGGRQTAVYSLLFGSVIFGIQILLWWLLYLIPELKR